MANNYLYFTELAGMPVFDLNIGAPGRIAAFPTPVIHNIARRTADPGCAGGGQFVQINGTGASNALYVTNWSCLIIQLHNHDLAGNLPALVFGNTKSVIYYAQASRRRRVGGREIDHKNSDHRAGSRLPAFQFHQHRLSGRHNQRPLQ